MKALTSGRLGGRFLALGLILGLGSCAMQAQFPAPKPKVYPWSNKSLSADERTDLVVKEMTLDEKMLMLHGQGMPFFANGGPSESNGGAGFTPAIRRLGLPAVQMADSAYGVTRGSAAGRYSTALPNNLGAAASWDIDGAYEYGQLIGRELRNQGYSMSLGGGVNLPREPRNGRTFEYMGDDPLLAGTLDGWVEKGVQSQHIIGDLKHYAINDQESGRNSVNANIDKRSMRETDLRAFEIALGISDAQGVMCSYNRINGDFACENSYVLNDVLKKAFKFKGFVLSDWGGTHSAVKASHAGLDQEQPDQYFYGAELKKALEKGEISEAEFNDHVHRVVRAIFASGLFDDPVVTQVPDVEGGYKVAQKTAEKSIVLLKNQGSVLPLKNAGSVVLIGGHADAGVICGGGSAQVDAPGGTAVHEARDNAMQSFMEKVWQPSSPLKALVNELPAAKVSYNSGDDVAAAVAAAKSADVAVVFVYQWESEGMDLPTLSLGEKQDKLVAAVAAANPKTVVVVESGSPALMPWVDQVAGVVEAWFPGIRGGEAIARILAGKVNPSGKLAITFPKSEADLPHPKLILPPPESELRFDIAEGEDISNIMSKMAKGLPAFQTTYDEGLKVGYKWYDAEKKTPLFAFGHGLSYTSYAYSDLKVKDEGKLSVSFKVKNTGSVDGTEIAQVYTTFPAAANEPPKRLIGWARVALAAGEEKTVELSLDHDRVTVFDEKSEAWKLVPGSYTIMAGAASDDLALKQAVDLK